MRKVLLKLAIITALVMVAGTAFADGFSDYHVANNALYANDYATAVEYYNSAIASGQMPPGNVATAYNRSGVALEKTGKYSEALKAYECAMKTVPGYRKACLNYQMLKQKMAMKGKKTYKKKKKK